MSRQRCFSVKLKSVATESFSGVTGLARWCCDTVFWYRDKAELAGRCCNRALGARDKDSVSRLLTNSCIEIKFLLLLLKNYFLIPSKGTKKLVDQNKTCMLLIKLLCQ